MMLALNDLQIGVCKNLELTKMITPFTFSLNENMFFDKRRITILIVEVLF